MKLLSSRRQIFGEVGRFVTGHNHLARHDALVLHGTDDNEENYCRFCSEDMETTYHVLAECPMFATERLHNFGEYHLVRPLDPFSNQSLISYLNDISFRALEDLD